MNEYNGYSLFNDVEDAALRAYNRARVIVNMFDQHLNKKTNKINGRGTGLVLGYFANIPEAERKVVHQNVEQQLKKENYASA